jgi:hypothetical protein
VHFAQIRKPRLPSGEVPVFDESPGVGIPFYAVALDEQNTRLRPLPETVPSIGGHRQDAAFQRESCDRRVRLHAQKNGAFAGGIA